MNNFNKLYHLILESIISLNAEFRKAMLLKGGFDLGATNDVNRFLKKYDNKTADFLCRYIANKEITKVNDERIKQVSKIIELNNSIDTQNFKGTLDLFILKYKETITKYLLKQAAKSVSYLDSIPLFYDKQTYQYGVVVYRVLNSKNGQLAVRKIIDAQWGKDANPWCLAARKDGLLKDAWTMWNSYNNFPKQIAFQNGKLIAFRASGEDYDKWWDREDQESSLLKLNDILLDIPVPQWTKEELQYKKLHKLEIFIDMFDLVLNEKTGRYDSDAYEVKVKAEDLIDGHLPVKFGEIKGCFTVVGENQLKDLDGMPTRIGRDLKITWTDITSLKGCPREVTGLFMLHKCNGLTNLLGGPRRVEGEMLINECANLTSLIGAPRAVTKNICIQACRKLKSAEGFPEYIGEQIKTYFLPLEFLTSDIFINAKKKAKEHIEELFIKKYNLVYNELTGRYDCTDTFGISISDAKYINKEGTFILPLGRIEGSFTLNNFDLLKSLKNGPTYVGHLLEITGCMYLRSLEGCPKEVGKVVRIIGNPYLSSLKGITQNIGGRLELSKNSNMDNSDDLPRNVKDRIYLGNLPENFYKSEAYKELYEQGKIYRVDK